MSEEEWRPVVGYEGRYEVSDLGRVRSLRWASKRLLKLRAGTYPRVDLYITKDAKPQTLNIHTLVAEAFIGPRCPGQQVRHFDDDGWNNTVENLSYGTPQDNSADAIRNGRHPQARKTHCPKNHPYDEVNTYRGANGGRACRACHRGYAARRRQTARGED